MTRVRRAIRKGAAGMGLVLAMASAAGAFDLTGTWEGRGSCSGFADGVKFRQSLPVIALVSQSGRDINMKFNVPLGTGETSGVAVPDAKKPDKGEIGFVACDTDPVTVFGVTGRALVSTKPSKAKGTLRGSAIVAGKDIGSLGITDGVVTCRFNLKLVSTTNPGIGSCVAP